MMAKGALTMSDVVHFPLLPWRNGRCMEQKCLPPYRKERAPFAFLPMKYFLRVLRSFLSLRGCARPAIILLFSNCARRERLRVSRGKDP